MEPAQKVQELQKQLDAANLQLQKSLDLIKELNIEKSRLIHENYALIREVALHKNRYEAIKNSTSNVMQSAKNLEKIVNGLLPEFQAVRTEVLDEAPPKTAGYVQGTSKGILSKSPSTPKPVSAVPAIVKQPTTPKHVTFAVNEETQTEQQNGVVEKTVTVSVADAALKKTSSVGVVGEMTSSTVKSTPKKAAPVAAVTPKKKQSIEEAAQNKEAPRKMPPTILKKLSPIEANVAKPALQPKLAEVKNGISDMSKMPMAKVLIDRINMDKLKTNSSVAISEKAVDVKLEPPKGRKSKRKADFDVPNDNMKQPRFTRSKSKTDKADESPVQSPISILGDIKKKAESPSNLVTSTPRSSPTVLLMEKMKLATNLDLTKQLSIKIESMSSARTSAHRFEKVAKRRQSMHM